MTARLVPLSEGSAPIVLEKAITLIGRHPECDVVLDENQKISRRHCCIAQVENRLVLRDLGSMNGIRVNGEAVVEVDLREGDEVTIGDEEFVLELSSSPAAEKGQSITKTPNPNAKRPKPASTGPSTPPRRPMSPADISQEFPVAIPEDEVDEDLRLNFDEPPSIPESPVITPKLGSLDRMKKTDDDIFKLDSGELKLDDLDNMGKK
jgi:hypothetical protein